MKEPEGEGPPRPSLQLLPLASGPKGGKKGRRAGRHRKEDGAERVEAPREGESEEPEADT